MLKRSEGSSLDLAKVVFKRSNTVLRLENSLSRTAAVGRFPPVENALMEIIKNKHLREAGKKDSRVRLSTN